MFYRIEEEKLVDFSDIKYNEECLETDIITQDELELHPNKVIVKNNILVLNPNYKKEEEQKEKERIAQLSMTKLDFVKAVADYNVTYEAIKVLLSQSPEAQMEWECCERIYRFNALLEPMAAQFGITPEQLDTIFKERGQ